MQRLQSWREEGRGREREGGRGRERERGRKGGGSARVDLKFRVGPILDWKSLVAESWIWNFGLANPRSEILAWPILDQDSLIRQSRMGNPWLANPGFGILGWPILDWESLGDQSKIGIDPFLEKLQGMASLTHEGLGC